MQHKLSTHQRTMHIQRPQLLGPGYQRTLPQLHPRLHPLERPLCLLQPLLPFLRPQFLGLHSSHRWILRWSILSLPTTRLSQLRPKGSGCKRSRPKCRLHRSTRPGQLQQKRFHPLASILRSFKPIHCQIQPQRNNNLMFQRMDPQQRTMREAGRQLPLLQPVRRMPALQPWLRSHFRWILCR